MPPRYIRSSIFGGTGSATEPTFIGSLAFPLSRSQCVIRYMTARKYVNDKYVDQRLDKLSTVRQLTQSIRHLRQAHGPLAHQERPQKQKCDRAHGSSLFILALLQYRKWTLAAIAQRAFRLVGPDRNLHAPLRSDNRQKGLSRYPLLCRSRRSRIGRHLPSPDHIYFSRF